MDIKYPNITIIFIINRIWYTIIFPPADNDRANDKVKILAIAIGYKLLNHCIPSPEWHPALWKRETGPNEGPKYYCNLLVISMFLIYWYQYR